MWVIKVQYKVEAHTLTWLFEHRTLLALYDRVYGVVVRAHESEISMQTHHACARALIWSQLIAKVLAGVRRSRCFGCYL